MRGPLVPSDLPLGRTRAEGFEDLVIDAVERIERRWEDAMASVQVVIEDVPPEPEQGDEVAVPLGRAEPAAPGRSAALVVYRRPIEGRSAPGPARAALVLDVVIEEVADLLGLEPSTVDPDYGSE
jgi:predicted Zn-dependent protease with MMP-like domain